MYDHNKLSNGIRVIGERITFVNSVSVGVWVRTGSRNENETTNGSAHFIEHMLFKGTKKRTAKQIASTVDNVGGQMNAFTGKENTCYYIKVLDSHADLAIDLLGDMLNESIFDENELLKEKSVIIEEINMYEDSPEDLIHEIMNNVIYENHPLGMSILGTTESLNKMTRDDLLKYMSEHYIPENIVISLSGNYDFDKILVLLEQAFGKIKNDNSIRANVSSPIFIEKNFEKTKPIEQVHYCKSFEAYPFTHERYFALMVLNNLLGSSMSSRLFQKIREELGLAYSVFSYTSNFQDSGALTIYAGMNPTQYDLAVKTIDEEIEKLLDGGITTEELYNSKEQLKGNYILGLESTSGRMVTLGKNLLMQNKVFTPKEILEKFEAVNMDEINQVIIDVFKNSKKASASLGNFDEIRNKKIEK